MFFHPDVELPNLEEAQSFWFVAHRLYCLVSVVTDFRECLHRKLNPNPQLRRLTLYPLSYGGSFTLYIIKMASRHFQDQLAHLDAGDLPSPSPAEASGRWAWHTNQTPLGRSLTGEW